jgi:hypothetical protein
MTETCETCRFWKLHGGVHGMNYGQCRRSPPEPQIPPPLTGTDDRVPLPAAIFPLSLSHEWWGEYQPRIDPPAPPCV